MVSGDTAMTSLPNEWTVTLCGDGAYLLVNEAAGEWHLLDRISLKPLAPEPRSRTKRTAARGSRSMVCFALRGHMEAR